MIFSPKQRSKVITNVFPQFRFGNNVLQYVKEFKYMGHIIADSLDREIRNINQTRLSQLNSIGGVGRKTP